MRPLKVSCFPLNFVSPGTPELSKGPNSLLPILNEVSKRIELAHRRVHFKAAELNPSRGGAPETPDSESSVGPTYAREI